MEPMTLVDWRAKLAERGFMGARQVTCTHGAAVLRAWGEFAAAEAALHELLGRAPEDEGALRALIRLLSETGRAGECAPLRRRLHTRRCRELGIPEPQWDAVIAYLEAAETGAPEPARTADAYVSALFDAYAASFDEKLRGALSYRAPEHVLEAVREALGGRGGVTVLELGCGTGLAGLLLRPLARHLTGIDLSEGMLARARERGVYDALHAGEVTAWLTASAASYELVVAVDVLVYFGALDALFAAVARRVEPGGLFAFTAEKGVEPGYRLQPTGRYVHHVDYLRACARDAGLAPVLEREAVLRTEEGEPVIGHVVVLGAQR
jgi:predicted TPR repeat methyltransferase